jgi:hypothetical protein
MYRLSICADTIFLDLPFEVVPPLSVVGWKTFPKASKRDEIG